MGDSELKEVKFMKYCERCKYGPRNEKYDPCNYCLEVSMRLGTEVPEEYEEK